MHRSSSSSRVSDKYFIIPSSSISQSQSWKQQSLETVPLQLPTYNPLSHAAMKERSRLRSAENAVHVIPLVLLLCAILLWFFSTPQNQGLD